MLIVSPNSTCDVCMESYMDGACMPHAITCGHIFCRACLYSIRPQCPLCRNDFSPWDIQKLHVDTADDAPSSTTVVPQVDRQLQRLLDDIAKTANGGATVEEMQRVMERCIGYHGAPLDSSYTPLGVSYLLLSTLLEAQKKLLLQADQLSELAAARDHIRDHLTWELEAAQRRNKELDDTRRDEKETALRNAENAQIQYDQMDARWRCKVESMEQEYQSLLEGLDRLRLATWKAVHGEATSIFDRSDTAIPYVGGVGLLSSEIITHVPTSSWRRTVTSGSSDVVGAQLDAVEPSGFRVYAILPRLLSR